ncbi:MAG: hypothetical protein IRY94_20130, partial [Rhodospirillaceae bacterium]|nr:hypothetical protein [Rhodospirillaceae bacterium]
MSTCSSPESFGSGIIGTSGAAAATVPGAASVAAGDSLEGEGAVSAAAISLETGAEASVPPVDSAGWAPLSVEAAGVSVAPVVPPALSAGCAGASVVSAGAAVVSLVDGAAAVSVVVSAGAAVVSLVDGAAAVSVVVSAGAAVVSLVDGAAAV